MTAPAPAADCSSCAALAADLAGLRAEVRAQLAALDRGVIESGTLAHQALVRVQTAEEGLIRAYEASRWTPPPAQVSPSAPAHLRAAAYGIRVLPGGAA